MGKDPYLDTVSRVLTRFRVPAVSDVWLMSVFTSGPFCFSRGLENFFVCLIFSPFYLFSVCIHVCMHEYMQEYVCMQACMWSLSFHHAGPGAQIQAVRFGKKYLYPWSYFTSPDGRGFLFFSF